MFKEVMNDLWLARISSWIPKLHKTPYKERYIAGSSTCSTKELSIHLTKILSAVKEGQQKYCRWGTPAYWSLVPRSSMFYLFEFCLKNMWNCSLTQQILSHSFYDWKLYELFQELSIHLRKILSAVKEGQQKYCETVYSRSGIIHMSILKNSKDLLDNLKSRSFSQVSSIGIRSNIIYIQTRYCWKLCPQEW
jgi:hypothetical protein